MYMVHMMCCGATYPDVKSSIGHVCDNSAAVAAHVEEYEVMYALLIEAGAIPHDARNEATAWARFVAPYPGMKNTDCAEGCCYNAVKNSCEDEFCHCHTYDSVGVVAPF